jgi:hypothetical protein
LETAFLVLARPAFLDIRGGEVNGFSPMGKRFLEKASGASENRSDEVFCDYQ